LSQYWSIVQPNQRWFSKFADKKKRNKIPKGNDGAVAKDIRF
jgi:hypothetical protein